MSSKVMASFSAFGVDLPSIDFSTVLYALSYVPTSPQTVSTFLNISRCSSDLIVHLLHGGGGRVSGSDVILCSHNLPFLCRAPLREKLCMKKKLYL